MRSINRFSVCGTPLFLASLGLLVINDIYLKTHFPGWLSGKLSDFTGLVVLPLLLFSIFPRHVLSAAFGVALLFIWWKAPYSTGFIDLANKAGIGFSRVVDYTDLLALLMIPVAARFFRLHRTADKAITSGRTIVVIPGVVISCLAVAGTTLTPYTRAFLIQGARQETVLTEAGVEEILATLADSPDFSCSNRSSTTEDQVRICNIDGIWFTYKILEGRVSFVVENSLPLFGKGKRVMRNTDQLVEEIKRAFGEAVEGLEYVEPLVDRVHQ